MIFKIGKRKFRKMKAYSKYAGACDSNMKIIDGLTVKEFLNHSELPHWLYWYSMNVLYREWQPTTDILKDSKLHTLWWIYYKNRFGIDE